MIITQKQRAVMDVIGAGNTNGSTVDLDELLARLPFPTTKQALQFMLRSLIRKGLILKGRISQRRGAGRRTYQLSEMGKGPQMAYVATTIADDEADKILDSIPEVDLLLSQ